MKNLKRVYFPVIIFIILIQCMSVSAMVEIDITSQERLIPYSPADDSKNPKCPFIPCINPPMKIARTYDRPIIKEEKREIPPLPLKVIFIAGNSTSRMVLMELNNRTYELKEGESEGGGLFKITEIGETSVKVFDSTIQKYRVLELGI